jgi:hypothetical protein
MKEGKYSLPKDVTPSASEGEYPKETYATDPRPIVIGSAILTLKNLLRDLKDLGINVSIQCSIDNKEGS